MHYASIVHEDIQLSERLEALVHDVLDFSALANVPTYKNRSLLRLSDFGNLIHSVLSVFLIDVGNNYSLYSRACK